MKRIPAVCLTLLLVLGVWFAARPVVADTADEEVEALSAIEVAEDDALEAVVDDAEEAPALEPPDTPESLDLTLVGVPVTTKNAYDIFGDGTAHYDEEEQTLTLKDFAATGNDAGGPMLSCDGDLTLELWGTNALVAGTSAVGVYVEGNLTIAGEGSLTAMGGYVTSGTESRGIKTTKSLIFDSGFSGTVVAIGGSASGSNGSSVGIECHGEGWNSTDSTCLAIGSGTVVALGGEAPYSAGMRADGALVQDGGLLVAQGGNATFESYGIAGSHDDPRGFNGGFAVLRAGLVDGGFAGPRSALVGEVQLNGTKLAGQVCWQDGSFFAGVVSEMEEGNLEFYTGIVLAPESAMQIDELVASGGNVTLTGDVYHVTTEGTSFGASGATDKLQITMKRSTALFVNLSETASDGTAHAGCMLHASEVGLFGKGTLVAVGGIATGPGSSSVGLYVDGACTVHGPDVVGVANTCGTNAQGYHGGESLTVTNSSLVGCGAAVRDSSSDSSGVAAMVEAKGTAAVLGVGGSARSTSHGLGGTVTSDGKARAMGVGGTSEMQSIGICNTATARGGMVVGIGTYAAHYSAGCNSGMVSYPGGTVVGLGGEVAAGTNNLSYGSWTWPHTSYAGDQVVAGRTRAYAITTSTYSDPYNACAGGATGLAYTNYTGTSGETPVSYDTKQETIYGFMRVVITGEPAPEDNTVPVAVGTTVGGSVTVTHTGGTDTVPSGSGMNLLVDDGTTVTLTAKAESGYKFVGFYEGIVGSSGFVEDNTGLLLSASATYSLVAEGTDEAQAVFEKLPAKQRVTWGRIYGQTALATMKEIAAKFGSAKVAIVTSNGSFKDALASSALAGHYKAFVLLTAKGSLSSETKTALTKAGVQTVYVVGGTGDVSKKAFDQLKKVKGVKTVKRVGSGSASAKAIALAKACSTHSDTVIIATQASFKDALSIAPYSYATKSPILYAESSKKLSDATLAYIKGGKYKKVIIVGGPLALPTSIETQLTKKAGIKAAGIMRLAGADPYATSEVIAKWATGQYKNGDKDGLYQGTKMTTIRYQPGTKLSANKLAIATGQNWKDAVCGAALLGKSKSVLLLGDDKTTKSNYSRAVAFCHAKATSMSNAYVLGGPSAVSTKVYDALVASTVV